MRRRPSPSLWSGNRPLRSIPPAFPAQEYSRDNFDRTDWLSQAEFQRAYSESLAKSERSKFNLAKRRRNLGETPVTTKLPAWLKMPGGKIVEDKPKADVVRRIFDLSVKGFGQQAITRKLRAGDVPPPGRAGIWYDSYVQKLLTSRTVVGEYHPHALQEGGPGVGR